MTESKWQLKRPNKMSKWRSGESGWKPTTKIKRSKFEINDYPQSKDQRRESPS